MNCQRSNANRIKPQRHYAFTLVEMLLVVTILGILAAIVLPRLAGQGEKAKRKAAITQIGAFKTALELFEVDNGKYPPGKSGLNDLIVKPRYAGKDWHPYMDSIPMDPWQHPYIYECPGKHMPNGYDLSSAGPDGQAGNDDDIANWKPND